MLTCPRRGFNSHYICPDASRDWSNRTLTIRWIDLEIGVTGQVIHRAIDIEDQNGMLFRSSATAVRSAELSARLASMMIIFFVMLVPTVAFFAFVKLIRKNQ